MRRSPRRRGVRQFIVDDVARWKKVVKDAGVSVD
jgi:hypothetical protein